MKLAILKNDDIVSTQKSWCPDLGTLSITIALLDFLGIDVKHYLIKSKEDLEACQDDLSDSDLVWPSFFNPYLVGEVEKLEVSLIGPGAVTLERLFTKNRRRKVLAKIQSYDHKQLTRPQGQEIKVGVLGTTNPHVDHLPYVVKVKEDGSLSQISTGQVLENVGEVAVRICQELGIEHFAQLKGYVDGEEVVIYDVNVMPNLSQARNYVRIFETHAPERTPDYAFKSVVCSIIASAAKKYDLEIPDKVILGANE